jgi:WD40 repeat protein
LAFISSTNHVEVMSLADVDRRVTLDCGEPVDKLEFGPEDELFLTFGQQGFKVRDARNGRVIKNLGPGTIHDSAEFSLDGRLLVTGTPQEYRIWETESWKIRYRVPRTDNVGCFIAFSPDGGTLAVCPSVYTIQLLDSTTFRELARLESPDPQIVSRIRFSRDGRRLAASSSGHRIELWDLTGIRSRLAHMQLDWRLSLGEQPRVARPAGGRIPSGHERLRVAPLTISVEMGRLDSFASVSTDWERATIAWSRKDFKTAIELYEDLLEAADNHAFACNELAWLYATCPPELRNPERALALANRAVRKAPLVSSYRNTRGVVNYRLDQFDAAIRDLNDTLEFSRVKAIDWYVLAMAYYKSGDPDRARACYDNAESWRKSQSALHPYWIEELDGLQSESKAVLGIEEDQPRDPIEKSSAQGDLDDQGSRHA